MSAVARSYKACSVGRMGGTLDLTNTAPGHFHDVSVTMPARHAWIVGAILRRELEDAAARFSYRGNRDKHQTQESATVKWSALNALDPDAGAALATRLRHPMDWEMGTHIF